VDDDGPGVDLRVHLGALANDQRVLGEDLPGELSIDPDLTLEGQLAVELAPLAQQRVHVTTANHHVLLLALQHRHPGSSSIDAGVGGSGTARLLPEPAGAGGQGRGRARIRSRSSYEKKSISSVPFPPRSLSRTLVPKRRCRSSTTARAATLTGAGRRVGAARCARTGARSLVQRAPRGRRGRRGRPVLPPRTRRGARGRGPSRARHWPPGLSPDLAGGGGGARWPRSPGPFRRARRPAPA